MKKLCVYCGSGELLTREHIIPHSILRRVPPDSLRYIESADKVILTDPVIKDVCKSCNEGVLSDLDAYGCDLFDDQCCVHPIPGVPVTFRYDFNRLSRWLLKISFNSARASRHSDAAILAQYATDIVKSTTPEITVCLELIEPTPAVAESNSGVIVDSHVNPTTLRISRIELEHGFVPRLHIMRLVALQGFWFALIIPKSSSGPKQQELIERHLILSNWQGISVVSPDAKELTLTSLGNDIVEMSRDNILAKARLFDQAIDRLDAKHKGRK